MPVPPVVLDTNVFVGAGFNPGSDSARILAAVRQGEVQMVWNEATRREILHILRRIPPLRQQEASDLFRPEGEYTGATEPEQFKFVADPDDRKFAALAQAAGAVLVSNDDHLLEQRERLEVDVLTPGAYWRRYQVEDEDLVE